MSPFQRKWWLSVKGHHFFSENNSCQNKWFPVNGNYILAKGIISCHMKYFPGKGVVSCKENYSSSTKMVSCESEQFAFKGFSVKLEISCQGENIPLKGNNFKPMESFKFKWNDLLWKEMDVIKREKITVEIKILPGQCKSFSFQSLNASSRTYS